MAVMYRNKLSGSTDGKNILHYDATGTNDIPTVIHTAVSGTTNYDEIWLWARPGDSNLSGGISCIVEFGHDTAPIALGNNPVYTCASPPGTILGTDPIATIINSNVITVTHVAHGISALPGVTASIIFSACPTVNGIPIIGSQILFSSRVDANRYALEVYDEGFAPLNATSTGSGGGSSVTLELKSAPIITHTAHGIPSFSPGTGRYEESVTLAGSTDVNGITAAEINTTHQIFPSDADHYIIAPASYGTSNGNGGGSGVTAVVNNTQYDNSFRVSLYKNLGWKNILSGQILNNGATVRTRLDAGVDNKILFQGFVNEIRG